MKRAILGLATLASVSLGAPALAYADAEEDAHLKAVAGEELLGKKKFAEAARTFEEAYQLHPLPMYQRKLGEAYKGAQDCGKAIPAFQSYFDKSKDADVLRDIQACKEQLAKGGPAGMRGEALVHVMLRQGRYQEALAAARKLGEEKETGTTHTLIGEALLAVGEEKKAMARFEKALRADPKAFRARLLLGTTQLARGEVKRGKTTLDRFFDHYNNDELKSAAELTDLAMAMGALERWQDAHRVFGEALKQDKSYVRAHVEWGKLLLDRYNITEARQTFEDALKIDPESPEAHVGMTRAYIDAFEISKAFDTVEKALKTNPHHVEARTVLATLHLLSEEPDKALVEVGKALAVSPADREALAIRAAAYYLADDRPAFERARKEALSAHPKDARFFVTVAGLAAIFHRYEEAIGLIEEGLKQDPGYWRAYAPLGTNYLRQGDEVKGREYLQKAWDKDQFNARTKNVLDLYDDSIQNYRFALTPHFRVRFHKNDEAVLKRYVVAHLERAYGDMVKRYGFKPKGPITVELFARSEDFAVRTVGTPSLASLGVCFGRVVTSMSPRVRRQFNWGQVLWHELNHVFTLQASKARVPRWLTEGMAVVEEGKGHPQWAREMDTRMFASLKANKLRKIAELNLGFTRARSIPEILQAYFQGAHAVMFLEEKVGEAGIVKMLRAFSEGKRLPAILPDVAGMSPDEFDTAFKAWLEKKLAHLVQGFEVDYDAHREALETLEKQANAEPKNAERWAQVAAGRFRKRDMKGAEEAVRTALAADPNQPLALYVGADLALFNKKDDEALAGYEKVLAAGKDGYDLRRSIALLYKRKKLTDKAREHLEAAKKKNPQATEPYEVLAEIYEQAGEKDKALQELVHVGRVDHKNFPVLKKLALQFAKKGEPERVIEFAELAYYLNPFDPKLHLELGRALAAKGEGERALAELQAALDSGIKTTADVHVEIAQIHLAAGRKPEALAAAQEALKTDAGNARAKELAEQSK